MGSLKLKKKQKKNENPETENKGIYESQGRWAFWKRKVNTGLCYRQPQQKGGWKRASVFVKSSLVIFDKPVLKE